MIFRKKRKYQKLFENLFRGIFHTFKRKNKITRYFKKDKSYFWLIKNLFNRKKAKKIRNAKIFVSWSIVVFLILGVISFRPSTEKQQITKIDKNINYNFMHWSATWRDFLFEWDTWHDSMITIDEEEPEPEIDSGSNQIVYTWILNTWTVNLTSWTNIFSWTTTWKTNTWWINTWILLVNPDVEILSWNVIYLPAYISKYIIRKLKAQIKQQKLLAEKINKDCISPRSWEVKDWEFVIAYEQRKDINNMCNAQKRYCHDWVLDGSFVQNECNEKAKYPYTEVEAKSQTQVKPDPYVQTTTPQNNSADFSVRWKINEQNIVKTDFQYSEWWREPITTKETWLKYMVEESDCKSPRWTAVRDWQFVAAYQAPLGFINLECKSEFRYCVNGKLWWSYSYQTCKYKDMTYNDFLVWNTDNEKPTTLDLMENITPDETTTSENIWTKIQSLFR